jgi:hypothetical protein
MAKEVTLSYLHNVVMTFSERAPFYVNFTFLHHFCVKSTIFNLILIVMKRNFPSSSFRNYNVIDIAEVMILLSPKIATNKLKILVLQ